MPEQFSGHLAIQQRVIPFYRVEFFKRLAARCQKGFTVAAGAPGVSEGILSADIADLPAWEYIRNYQTFTGAWMLLWQPDITRWLEKKQPDALIVEANPRYLSNYRAISWMKARGKPVLGWGLGVPKARKNPMGFTSRLMRWYIRHLDAIIAYSSIGAEEYRLVGADRVFVAPNAVAGDQTTADGKGKTSEIRKRILFVGRLQERKKVDILIRACALLPPESQPELVIVGDGPSVENLKHLAAQLFPTTQFAGLLVGESLAEEYKNADLFVLPGTGGLAVQEALSYGLPVIVGEGDGTQSDLVSTSNGWIFLGDTPESLARIIRDALSDPVRLRAMGARSLEIATRTVNLDNMVAGFINALESVC